MEWLVAALLLYTNGNVNVIYNQELYFLDEKSCIEYVLLNSDSILLGANTFLDTQFGKDHGVTVEQVTCQQEQDIPE